MPQAWYQLLFSCEHASNRIPAKHRAVAEDAGRVLGTHRGHDPGTLELGRRLARKFRAPLFVGKWSRLLIELNRSRHHPRLWSEFSRQLAGSEKQSLIDDYYLPYRDAVESEIRRLESSGGPVLHVSLHSFTPVLDGVVRNADLGLLYDPARAAERDLCGRWQVALRELAPGLGVRRNYPYRGVADGFTTHLRRRFTANEYLGIELELNQRFVGARGWRDLQRVIADSLARLLKHHAR
ncbi:MAG TPA: N-formylglutamate amidohydrolase [Verrucomicrobiales bacterium]|nr:N-formylglutamate amidohydrolase [Verrucomicrobiales bacterium]